MGGEVLLAFDVPGIPRPQGSKRGFARGGKVVLLEMSKGLADWRSIVAYTAREKWMTRALMEGPLEVGIVFIFPRPKSHYIAGNPARGLRPNAPLYHSGTPDLSKLLRSTEDALTGVVWKDDALVARYYPAEKRYGDSPGANITISRPALY